MQFVKLGLHHEDLVHDIVFDYYGNRFASCSSDKRIKVWDLNEDSGEWTCSEISGAHLDTIWRLSWAHPEFGQVQNNYVIRSLSNKVSPSNSY